MNSPAGLSTRQQLFVISCVVLGTILLTASVVSSGRKPAQRQINLPVVKSHSKSLQFIDTEKADFGFITRMRNTSNKSITAYTVSLCDTPLFAEDYSIGNRSIGPGETIEIKVAAAAVPHNCRDTTTPPIITVLAVVFDDRSTEGEFKWAKGILDTRRGEKIQLKRINRLLTQAANWVDADKSVGINRLKSEIAALPVDEGELPDVRGGFVSAKDRILFLIAELEQWHSNSKESSIQSQSAARPPLRLEFAGIRNFREGLSKLKTVNEELISKY